MVPDFQAFFRPVLELATTQEWRAPELVSAVADKLGLSDEDRKEPTAGGSKSRVEDRVRWSLTHLYRAGLLDRPGRGRYVISERGRTLLAGFSGKITLEKLDEYPEYLAFRKSVGANGEVNERHDPTDQVPQISTVKIDKKEAPNERLQQAYIELKAALAADLLDETRNISPATFEQLIVDLLLKMGFGGSKAEAGERLGKSGDGGVDGVIRQDALGLVRSFHCRPSFGPGFLWVFSFSVWRGTGHGWVGAEEFEGGGLQRGWLGEHGEGGVWRLRHGDDVLGQGDEVLHQPGAVDDRQAGLGPPVGALALGDRSDGGGLDR